MLGTQAHLILRVDAVGLGRVYGHIMGPAHFLRRDVRAHVWEYALAAAMVGAAVVALMTRIDVQDFDAFRFHADTWWSWTLTIAICAGLVGRRRWPLRSLAVGLALMLPLELDRHRDSIAFFALVIALYSVAAHLPRRLAWRGVAMVAGLYGVLTAGGVTIIRIAPVAGPTFFATGFALGRMRSRSRARQQRQVEMAIERAAAVVETADLSAAAERLRMARDLHDVVAHSLSVIAVQAGIGAHLIDREPVEAERALDAIRTTSATATSELGRLITILRDGSPPGDTAAPTLADVARLVEHIRAADVPVTLTVDGDVRLLPAGVSLAAYRIVQEALTNVVRHAGRAESTVTIRVNDELIDLLIDDNGRGSTTALDPSDRGGGNGLVGIRERAQMYGGEITSGPRPGGGFRVHATLQSSANAPDGDIDTSPTISRIAPPEPERTRPRLPPWQWDIMLAALMTVLGILDIFKSEPPAIGPQFAPADRWAWLLRVGCGLVLVARRRYPAVTLGAVWLLTIALALANYQLGVSIFILWIALYTVGSYASTRRLVGGGIGSFIGMAIVAWSTPPDLTASGAVWIVLLFAGAAIAGYVAQRDRRLLDNDLTEHADTATATARTALLNITNERLRIADELSTVLARSINSISVHAGTGLPDISHDLVAARNSLDAISTISREALNDLRRLLKRIRSETGPDSYRPAISSLSTIGDTP
jgi:signal transduction histidine kinase